MVDLFGSVYFLVLSDESSSDWSWTRSDTVLDLPADLISLLLYMLPFTEGSHVFWDTTCFFQHFHSTAVYILYCMMLHSVHLLLLLNQ